MAAAVVKRSMTSQRSYHKSQAPPPSKSFQNVEHSHDLLKQLNSLRIERLLCDGTLIAGEQHFMVHRAVLASCSDYFRRVFTENDNIHDVQLSNSINPRGVELIIQYAYTSQIMLTLENVEGVLYTALQLRMNKVVELCLEYLTSILTVENCIHILNLAEQFEFRGLMLVTQDFIIDNFIAVSHTPEFQTLNAEQVTFFLSQDRMATNSELQLFQIGAKWLNHESEERKEYAAQLMRNIRFPLISSNDLVDHVQNQEFMMQQQECHQYLLEALNYHLVPHRQHAMQSPRTKLRSTNEVILALGGESPPKRVSDRVMIFDEFHAQWKSLTSMPMKRVDHCVAELNQYLYVVGGQITLNSNGKDSIGTVHRYDPRFNTWLQMCPMQQRRAFFTLVAYHGCLYAMGGKNEQGALSSVECYEPNRNQWKFVARMHTGAYALSGCVLQNKLYITGGFMNRNFSAEVYIYNHVSDEWTNKCPMNVARGFHMMCTVKNKLYVMGGNHLNVYGDRVDVMSVECYSMESDTWTMVSPMLTGLSMAGVTVTENRKIYIVGGYNGLSRQRERDVHSYSIDEDEWDVVGELPDAALRMACCTLTLPYNVFTAADGHSSDSLSMSQPTTSSSRHYSISSSNSPR
ncbi:kelch-like protein 13 [Antedon mediterranea]|uniref:kelch-like protein 13 n=1 Tax=Antedon mediterranea TaxID=105859 RepID=UPI003AF80DAB